MRCFVLLGVFLFTGFGALAVPSPAAAIAVTRYVANNGLDSPTCGTITAPCRSISQGTAVAATGDHVVVGPGRYGRIDRLHEGTPGDETGGEFCDCTVLVAKAITVESSLGAASTIIERDPISFGPDTGWAVRLGATGAVFGTRGRGFTVRSTAGGVFVGARATVEANRVTAAGTAMLVSATADQSTVRGNIVSDGLVGISLSGTATTVTTNVIDSNQIGIHVATASQVKITSNLVVNNLHGIQVDSNGATISSNLLGSNGRSGIFVTTAAGTVINSNNFLHNGGDVGMTNCGLVSQSSHPVNAERNYWGSVAGPGANPADAVCASGTGAVDSVPFLTSAVRVVNETGR